MSQNAIVHIGRWGILAWMLATWQWGWDLKSVLAGGNLTTAELKPAVGRLQRSI